MSRGEIEAVLRCRIVGEQKDDDKVNTYVNYAVEYLGFVRSSGYILTVVYDPAGKAVRIVSPRDKAIDRGTWP
jgi:hypothetical protein